MLEIMTIADEDLFPSEAVKTEGMSKMSSLSVTKDGILKDFHTFCFLKCAPPQMVMLDQYPPEGH